MPSQEVLDVQSKQRWERQASHHRAIVLGHLWGYRLAAMLLRADCRSSELLPASVQSR
jgi:hypothetical protein